MTYPTQLPIAFNPELDLKFERTIDLTPEQVWQAWTQPEHIVHWFTPAPWKTTACDIDLRRGGTFRTVMCSPDGESCDNMGTYLEIIKNQLLIWTDALLPSYRPAENAFVTAIIQLAPSGAGTLYTATVLHKNQQDKQKHEAMGFHEGWGKALDQLVAHMKSIENISNRNMPA